MLIRRAQKIILDPKANFKVRVATQADAQQIADLHVASWRTTYRGMLTDAYLDGEAMLQERSVSWSNRLKHPQPRQLVLIAEIDDRPVGFACAIGGADPQLGTLLDNLHVRQEFQGRGLGAKLMSEVAKWCLAESPGEGIFLWVIEANLPARQFYEKRGATYVDGDLWNAPDGGSIPSICYAWKNVSKLIDE